MKSNRWPEVRRMRCLNLLGMYKKEVKVRVSLSFRVKFHSQRISYIYISAYTYPQSSADDKARGSKQCPILDELVHIYYIWAEVSSGDE